MPLPSFTLEDSRISLMQDSIVIKDRSKEQRTNLFIGSTIWITYGVFCGWSYFSSENVFILGSGILIALLHIIILFTFLQRSTQSEIPLSEIKRVKFSANMLGEESMTLYLRNGLKRKVSAIAPVSNELRSYFEEKGIRE